MYVQTNGRGESNMSQTEYKLPNAAQIGGLAIIAVGAWHVLLAVNDAMEQAEIRQRRKHNVRVFFAFTAGIIIVITVTLTISM